MAEISVSGNSDAEKTVRAAVTDKLSVTMAEIGLHWMRQSKRYAPRSPTMAQINSYRKKKFIEAKKRGNARRKFKKRTSQRVMPGGLEKSIEFERFVSVDGSVSASVFVPLNSPAGKYAGKIHDERFKSWRFLGIGSVRKGGPVGEKFIERAGTDNQQNYHKKIERAIDKAIADALKKTNRSRYGQACVQL